MTARSRTGGVVSSLPKKKKGGRRGGSNKWRGVAMAPVTAIVEMDVRVAYASPMERFVEEWKRLPPLVRASVAMQLVEWSGARQRTDPAVLANLGLHRRNQVHARFRQALAMIQNFAAGLCKEADDEAIRRGIDADLDTTYTARWSAMK